MGDIKKPKKKYSNPSHPWQKTRIDEERVLMKEYGLKNKKEIWKAVAQLKRFTSQAKKLTGLFSAQADIEKKQLIDKVTSYGLLSDNAKLSEILTLTTRDLLERRFQTVLVRKEVARTMGQARQFIVHKHVVLNGKKTNVPSVLVKKLDESNITFADNSAYIDDQHPERSVKAEPAGPATESEVKA
ncbi:30S ribosomal protein S4 [Candidatus Woesearchaeota archaeon CG11_big_fil_rev_8_21_14_0_20_43_8]|nr:MAG: 30S ribosomal protein S4 [Candidatus Woesearchaeota archaeon CG11_big_fil_rev_8_21_14_0_20_43_8]PIO06697.1 MAG: 30S ribosomal protein S4 [Candidatus Woesearchaeota archaeon CG08_land_8_20_14_0_20_43_7]